VTTAVHHDVERLRAEKARAIDSGARTIFPPSVKIAAREATWMRPAMTECYY